MDIHLSNGRTETGCFLVVRNVTGIAEERGFRLYWTNDGRYLTPALGLVTSNPFRREREAIAYGERRFGERAKRLSILNLRLGVVAGRRPARLGAHCGG